MPRPHESPVSPIPIIGDTDTLAFDVTGIDTDGIMSLEMVDTPALARYSEREALPDNTPIELYPM